MHSLSARARSSRFILSALLLLLGCVYFFMLSATVAGDDQWTVSESRLRGTHTPFGSTERTAKTVVSEKTVAQFGTADAEHMHGSMLGFDQGLPLWAPTPLGKPLDQWVEAELHHAHDHYGFNINVTNSLPLNRKPTDFRDAGCRKFSNDFSPTSIVMTFYNEDLSVLLRTLHSLLNTVPMNLLGEIILIDDGSNSTSHPWLFDPLETYVRRGLPKVRLTRFTERHGLMRGRMHGANLARFDNLLFFDTHIECGPHWINPLLARLHEDYRNVALPSIESLDPNTFDRTSTGLDLLGFTWALGQAAKSPHLKRKVSRTEPNRTPIMAGGLFAITARWFSELGEYDHELQKWGGEEMEISFKIWQCGGKIECIPCSRIAHAFRSTKHTKKVSYIDGDSLARNRNRVAQVWMDDAHLKIMRIAAAPMPKGQDIGDLTEARKIRTNLQCRDFSWYLKNEYPELYIPDLSTSRYGAMRVAGGTQCLDTFGAESAGKTLGVYGCHGEHGTQAFIFTNDGMVRLASEFDFVMCASLETVDNVQYLNTVWCNAAKPWTLDAAGKMKQGTNCLKTNAESKLQAVSCEDPLALSWEWKDPDLQAE